MSRSTAALPPQWTLAEIERDALLARAEFRRRRLAEPRARYLAVFDSAQPLVTQLVEDLERVLAGGPGAEELLKRLWSSDEGRAAFRYLGAPPISDDDLTTLAERALTGAAATKPAGYGEALLAVMRVVVDPRRFPWLESGESPGSVERAAATLATTSLLASQRVQTLRRSDEKAAVEGAVKGLLVGMGWQHVSARTSRGIQVLVTDALGPRRFCTQTNLGSDNADVIVQLDDGRLLAIECKGSNSEINSRKRLNKEAAQNARAWLAAFGSAQVVPAVALQGVFKPSYIAEAQTTPMAVFWSHRLDDLRSFILKPG